MNYSKTSEPADIGSFYTQIGRLKRLYTSLTNVDLNYEERRKGEFIKNLVKKLVVSEKEIKGVMDKSIRTLG
tara:strand:+ start:290 stop:505 length:216 start_codon:yes stop_codon:yes gene_type:complete